MGKPERLDLDDIGSKMARDEGVLLSINADAHSTEELDNLRYGTGKARRGWLEPRHVCNTRSPAEVQKILKRQSHFGHQRPDDLVT